LLNFAKSRLSVVLSGVLAGGCAVMLAEADAVDYVVLAAMVAGLAWFLVERARRRAEAGVDRFTGPGRFTFVFARGVTEGALADEHATCAKAERALSAIGWDDVGVVFYWPVRSADQPVVYRGRRREWRDVPELAGLDAVGDGYGGMRAGGSVYVAWYHDGRTPEALTAHELTHMHMPGVDHGSEAFLAEERKLLEEMRRS
jgi:hypothetical protein